MKHVFMSKQVSQIKADTLIIPVAEYEKLSDPLIKQIDASTGGLLTSLLDREEFSGKKGQVVSFFRPEEFQSEWIVLTGLGKRKELEPDSYRLALGTASKDNCVAKCDQLGIYCGAETNALSLQAMVEGLLLGSYKFLEYKTGTDSESKWNVANVLWCCKNASGLRRLEKAVGRGEIIAEGQILARQLTATPPGDLTPTIYAKKAKSLSKKSGLACRVLDEAAIEREQMGALLSVSCGSSEPSRFIILQHKGGPAKQKPIVLVGKGVTFDSGGLSLKGATSMVDMKQDMAGSAVVLATMITASRLDIPRNLVGLIPSAENMPSGSATRPGDIVTARNGKTIEIINTDAEGRLILADALDYANEFDPQAVIDIATLTGATLYSLGYAGAPMVGNNRRLMGLLKGASESSGERLWEFPLWDDYKEQMKSPIADLVNSGGRGAGTLTAAAFLSSFIGDYPWAHVDIACMDLEIKGKPYVPKGASGFGVRLMIDLLSNWKKV